MNVDDENGDPATDLELVLGHSNWCIQRRLNNDLGAGANAGSRVDMTFVAKDPLSELVWSPHKGLSLKCTGCSLTDNKSSLLWGAGPSNAVLSPPHSVTAGMSMPEKTLDGENFGTSQATFHVKSEAARRDLDQSPRSDAIMPVCGSSHEPGTGHLDKRMTDILSSKTEQPETGVAQNEPLSGNSHGGERDDGGGNQTLASEARLVHESRVPDVPLPNLVKLGSTAENNVRTLTSKNACSGGSKIVASDSAHKMKNSSRQEEKILPTNETVPVKHSSTDSKIYTSRRKGKEKALSDGNVGGRMLKQDDDSHESVESCNRTGLFSKGKKRQGSEHHLIVGSKRVRKQIQESPGSSSYIRKDSSFMNWISNMMKGFLKSNQEEAPSLGLTLAHTDHDRESPKQNLITCYRNQDPGCRNTGFQSIFQSMYCSNPKIQETRTVNANYPAGGEAEELELPKKMCDINVTPIRCREENDNFCKQFLLSNEKFNESISGNGVGSSTQPQILSVSIAGSMENKNLCKLVLGKDKDGISSNSFLGKHKTSNAENNDSDLPSEGKTNNYGCRSGPLRSLWITRFSQKASGPLMKIDHRTQSTDGAPDCSADCTRLISHSQYHVGASNDQKKMEDREHCTKEPLNVIEKELQNCASNIEASTGLNRIKDRDDQKFINKLNPILLSQRLKNLEAMASVFARRLDALKHIVPTDIKDNVDCATTTCLYCGIQGHHLRDCADITETELEDLLRNINSYDKSEESPCLCIRCFQLNHWAIECPYTSRQLHQSDHVGSLNRSPRKQQLNAGNKSSSNLLDNEGQFQAASAHKVYAGNTLRIEDDPNLEQKSNENAASEIVIFKLNSVKKYKASSSGKIKLNKNEITSFHNVVSRQIPDVPKGIFDAIQRLRLSRKDILKCMKTHISLSNLDGFFLRLRLGKWEEGLRETHYHVACITGPQRERSPQKNAKKPISVNVGGIKCLVESQYISNHGFLQDELIAWWFSTSAHGGKTPSEEDLKVKIKGRKMLGL